MASTISSAIDLYDDEILAVEKVMHALEQKVGRYVDREGLRREIIGRFEEIGLVIDVVVEAELGDDGKALVAAEDPIFFTAVIKDHCERRSFDYDKQVHEVTHDLLGLGEGGVIKTDPAMIEEIFKPGST